MSEVLKIISSMATRQILADLAVLYQRQTGIAVELKSMGGVEAAKVVRNGSDADVVILASAAMEILEREGFLIADTRHDFALSGIAIAIRSGQPRFAIENESDVRQAIVAGDRLGFSTGPSGDHIKRLLERWGLTHALASRLIQAAPGVPVADMLARGDADIGIQQLSELLGCQGIDILGPLPPDIQAITVFSAGISAASSQEASARDLIAFLASREMADVKQRHGMSAPTP